MAEPREKDPQEPGLLAHVGSVLAAFFGVQSNKARERDFTKGKPATYIVLGIILTILFILLIFGVVKLVLSLAGV
ncbi:MAG: DUF2970 domain-containing protein [Chromatiales bacterium]|jgi:hypothetical protein